MVWINGILITIMQAPDLTNQEKLEEVYAMTMENNKMLRSMKRQQTFANIFRLLYWIVIIISLGGVYYYVRPIVDAFTTNGGKIEESINQFNILRAQFPEAKLFDQIFHKNTDPITATTTPS